MEESLAMLLTKGEVKGRSRGPLPTLEPKFPCYRYSVPTDVPEPMTIVHASIVVRASREPHPRSFRARAGRAVSALSILSSSTAQKPGAH